MSEAIEVPLREEPLAARSLEVTRGATIYPAPFAARVSGRTKRKLGDVFGLTNFGVNLTRLDPGSESALLHTHSRQDEFIYVLEGQPLLRLGEREFRLEPGDCMGFRGNSGLAHQLRNDTAEPVTYLEIGDRSPGDCVFYPEDDLAVSLDENGKWQVSRKDGSPCC